MTMPLSVLLALIIGLSVVMYLLLRPLQVLKTSEFIVSHGFVGVGLAIIMGWLWSNRGQFLEATMIMGGIWTLCGGLCFVAVYVLRKRG